ncbi:MULTISPECIES: DUF5683 domain-containing protein [Prevotella]|uniref:DUF5683 domain-containing protein n=1 Tax=Prevotella TaxID=838 RepID=UPI001E575286|nr:DUF5683 domain-containing protein [Prevotella sp. oral taxon 820]
MWPAKVFSQAHTSDNSERIILADSSRIMKENVLTREDSLKLKLIGNNTAHPQKKKDWSSWRPNPKRALWLALVLPGAGQIYNRKYWKLPIVYGGFVGCAYAMNWNNQMFHDYSQAYMDIMDDDPNTQSYNQFLHLGAKIDASNIQQYQSLFKKRKDRYRRWRDMSFFVLIGVYALSVIDAYVDASLSEFDISNDLSLRVQPTVLNNRFSSNPIKSSSFGLNCSLTF